MNLRKSGESSLGNLKMKSALCSQTFHSEVSPIISFLQNLLTTTKLTDGILLLVGRDEEVELRRRKRRKTDGQKVCELQ